MKLRNLILAASLLALGACSEDGPVAPAQQESNQLAMGFGVKSSNLSRGDNLQTVQKDFGVWAYKGADESDITSAGNAIMLNYLVGWCPGAGNGGYGAAPTGAMDCGSQWYYQYMGSSTTAPQVGTTSNVSEQFLKYWDFSKANTYFYAYTPYENGATTPTFNPATRTMRFTEGFCITIGEDADKAAIPMYAATVVPKSAYGQDVALEFKRFHAQMKLAFCEDIEGYSVTILDAYDPAGTSTATTVAYNNANAGVYGTCGWSMTQGAPTTVTDPILGEYTTHSYTRVNHLYKGQPEVVFTNGVGVVDYVDSWSTPIPCFWKAPAKDDDNNPVAISTDKTNPTYSPTVYNVLPVTVATAVGYRLFVSYKLTSTDGSGETICVYNAPVYVPANYAEWQANHVYTYVLRITKGTSGTTEEPSDPDPTKPEEPALYPIVFNNLTISNYEDGTTTVHDVSTGDVEVL